MRAVSQVFVFHRGKKLSERLLRDGAWSSAQSVEGKRKTAQAHRQTAMKWGKSNSHNTGFKMICYHWVGSECVCVLLHSQLHLMTANSLSYCVWAMGWDFEGPHKSRAEFVLLAFKSLNWRCIKNSLNHWQRLQHMLGEHVKFLKEQSLCEFL